MRRMLGLMAAVFFIAVLPLAAANSIRLNPGDWVSVKPDGGTLSVIQNTPTIIKVQCAATALSVLESVEPDTVTPVVLIPNQKLIVQPNGGVLQLKTNTASLVKIYCATAPKTGKWSGTSDGNYPCSFFVISAGTQWKTFVLKTGFKVGPCSGTIETTVYGPGSISSNKFSFSSGDYSFTGQFTSTTTAQGTFRYTNHYVGWPCGYLSKSGTWKGTIQAALQGDEARISRSERNSRREVIVLDGSGDTLTEPDQ